MVTFRRLERISSHETPNILRRIFRDYILGKDFITLQGNYMKKDSLHLTSSWKEKR